MYRFRLKWYPDSGHGLDSPSTLSGCFFVTDLEVIVLMYKVKEREKVAENPVVLRAFDDRIDLTYDFRVELFELWKKNGKGAIALRLEERGLGEEMVGSAYSDCLAEMFRSSGYPRPHAIEKDAMNRYLMENPVFKSGLFEYAYGGVSIKSDFRSAMLQIYPQKPVKDILKESGINLKDLGYEKLKALKKDVARQLGKTGTVKPVQPKEKEQEQAEDEEQRIEDIESAVLWHPYISGMRNGEVVMTRAFYNEASVLMPVDMEKVLDIYEIDMSWTDIMSRTKMGIKLERWRSTKDDQPKPSPMVIRIQKKRKAFMEERVRENFRTLPQIYGKVRKRGVSYKISAWIKELPYDTSGYYTKKRVAELMGISRTMYYKCIRDPYYGRRIMEKEKHDVELIRQVAEYKGFKKGYRQIYMMMPELTGEKLGIHRIMNLMRRYGLNCGIREKKMSRYAMKELMERNKKPNLLMRDFKAHRPNEVRLTDVTYLDYGEDMRAYGSASVDPVTGRLICFVISERNDLDLAMATLTAMDEYPMKSGGIIHSDQGTLYFLDEYQDMVRSFGMHQSMSRRGNCWDNAPQESFFGHFKDECDYKKCRTIDELRCEISRYSVYYNEERKMWMRMKMTPMEYETYLLGLDDEAFGEYMERERAAYEVRRKKSADTAMESAREMKEKAKKEMEEECCEQV